MIIQRAYMKKSAFTMIELVFVIVVLGILAAVALPRLGSTMTQAQIASAQGDVAAIRASIASARQKELVKGVNSYITKLSTAAVGGTPLFDGNGSITVLSYPINAKSVGGWAKTGANTYTFSIDGTATKTATFTYAPATGLFNCDTTKSFCQKIVQ